MAQTAVEWQFDELQKIEKAWAKEVIDGMEFVKMKYEILEKSKEMEKEQIKKERLEAYNNGYANGQNDAYAI